MAMSELQVLDLIVRPVLADFLAMTEKERRDLWVSCELQDELGVSAEDFIELAWRLGRGLQEYGLDIKIGTQELKKPCMTVGDVLMLICKKIDEAEVPASEVVTLATTA